MNALGRRRLSSNWYGSPSNGGHCDLAGHARLRSLVAALSTWRSVIAARAARVDIRACCIRSADLVAASTRHEQGLPVRASAALIAFTDALVVSLPALPDGIEGTRGDHRCGRCALCSVPLARPPVVGTLAWPGYRASAMDRPCGLSAPRADRESPGQISEHRPR
jgi:hypothetical protein